MRFSSNTQGIGRIVGPTPDGLGEKHFGMAIVIDNRHVMTCCHVLNDTLGRQSRLDPEQPPPDRLIAIRFPYADNARVAGVVVKWGLVLSRPKDVAVLELEEDAPSAAGVAVFSEAEVRRQSWSCIGWDEEGIDREAQGEFGPVLARDERQLNGPTGVAVRIAGGYSGAGVWSDAPNAFVGMVVTRDRDQFENGVAYAIPTGMLLQVWPKLRLVRDGRLSDPILTDAQTNWAEPTPLPESVRLIDALSDLTEGQLAVVARALGIKPADLPLRDLRAQAVEIHRRASLDRTGQRLQLLRSLVLNYNPEAFT